MEHKTEVTVWLTNPEDYVWGRKPHIWIDQHGTDMTSQGWLKVASKESVVEFDLPDQDTIRGQSVDALREAIRKIDAEAQKAKNHLEGRIQNLLAIGHEEAAQDAWPVQGDSNNDDPCDVPF